MSPVGLILLAVYNLLHFQFMINTILLFKPQYQSHKYNMNNSQSPAEQETAQAKAEAQEKSSQLMEQASSAAQSAKESVQQAGQQIKEKAQEATEAVKNATGMNK